VTDYYYIGSDKALHLVEGRLDAWNTENIEEFIHEFDVPIQLEMYSPEKPQELFQLYLFVKYHFDRYPTSTIQIANYLNSNIEECHIHRKKTLLLRDLREPEQLLLETGELVTIKHTK